MGAYIRNNAGGIETIYNIVGIFQEKPVPLLAFSQLVFNPHASRYFPQQFVRLPHIVSGGNNADDFTVFVLYRRQRYFHRKGPAALPYKINCALFLFFSRRDRRNRLAYNFRFVGYDFQRSAYKILFLPYYVFCTSVHFYDRSIRLHQENHVGNARENFVRGDPRRQHHEPVACNRVPYAKHPDHDNNRNDRWYIFMVRHRKHYARHTARQYCYGKRDENDPGLFAQPHGCSGATP